MTERDRLHVGRGVAYLVDRDREVCTRTPALYMYIVDHINPLRMRRRVSVVALCVCLSVTTLVARQLISAVQAWYQQNQHDTSKVFNSWISLKTLCSKVMALFTLRSARPYMNTVCILLVSIDIIDYVNGIGNRSREQYMPY